MSEYNFPDELRFVVDFGDECGQAYFIRRCPKCYRFVKPDKKLYNPLLDRPNATCSRCGRVEMPFEGWF